MIDLHMHTFFSDGVLVPAELARRAENIGYNVMAITDHVDMSNFDFVVPRIVHVAQKLNAVSKIQIIPGAEITHVPPSLIKELAADIRRLGAKLIVVHGQTIAEPVMEGTNLSAVQADINILAHPGLVDEQTCQIASERGIYFEITSRKGHSLTNGHVAAMAQKFGIQTVINSDTHTPSDLLTMQCAKSVLAGAGMDVARINATLNNSKEIVKKIL